MAETFPKRRRFPRLALRNPLMVRRVGASDDEDFGRTGSVGLGGCMFVHERALGVGSELELLIPVEDRVIETRARVVYEHPRGEGAVEVGAEFLDIREEDRASLGAALASGAQPPDA